MRFISATKQLFVVTTDLKSYSRISEILLLPRDEMTLLTNQSAILPAAFPYYFAPTCLSDGCSLSQANRCHVNSTSSALQIADVATTPASPPRPRVTHRAVRDPKAFVIATNTHVFTVTYSRYRDVLLIRLQLMGDRVAVAVARRAIFCSTIPPAHFFSHSLLRNRWWMRLRLLFWRSE